jgi:hypothetical protein
MYGSWTRIRTATALTLALSVSPAFADVDFVDDSFDLSEYLQTPIFLSDPTVALKYGSAGGVLQFNVDYSDLDIASEAAVGLFNASFLINPATQGKITSIDASVVKDVTLLGALSDTPFTNVFRPAIEQDGIVYLAAIPGPGTGFTPSTTGDNLLSETGLTSADFLSFNFGTGAFGTGHPNFSGDPMLFGLAQVSSSGIGAHLGSTLDAFIDYKDLGLDIHGVSVPEPNALALLGLTAVGLGWLVRRKAATR